MKATNLVRRRNGSALSAAGTSRESLKMVIPTTRKPSPAPQGGNSFRRAIAGLFNHHLLIAAGAMAVFHAIPLQAAQIWVPVNLSGEKCSLRLFQVEGAYYSPNLSCNNSTITVDPLEFLNQMIVNGTNNTISINGGSLIFRGNTSVIGHDNFLFVEETAVNQVTGCYTNIP